MKLNIDFTMIITVLVLVQLYILNIKTKPEENVQEKVKSPIGGEKELVGTSEPIEGQILVVHRRNGEEKSYSCKTVA
jgi:hypothetical protein